jgi:hypothetical protein
MELFLTGFADWPAATSKLLESEHLSHDYGVMHVVRQKTVDLQDMSQVC